MTIKDEVRSIAERVRVAIADWLFPGASGESTQFGIQSSGIFLPSAWADSNTSLPTVSGRVRVYQSFTPMRVVADEQLIITFKNDKSEAKVAVDAEGAGDLMLISVFAGNRNYFPTAPDQSMGISGRCLAPQSLGNRVSWPTINGGIDLSVTWAITASALHRAAPPPGFTAEDLHSIEVCAILNCFGERVK